MRPKSHKSAVTSTYASGLPLKTRSLCPDCKRVLDAEVYERDGAVFIKKDCPEHGSFDEVYYEDAEYYNFARKFATGSRSIENPNVGKAIENNGSNCPNDCGLCKNHHTHTGLANIAVTNRCDLSCWYCFFFAKEGSAIYEPSIKQIVNMVKNLRNERPVGTNACQVTGGEPTLRKDIVEIVSAIKKEGYDHIQLNTHGINFAFNPELAKKLSGAGATTVYLSFDGTTPETNPKNHYEIPLILDACRKGGLSIVLVPTLIRSVNDHNLGPIINFALNNLDIVRGVNFQPVSLVGRMPKTLRDKQRITIPGAIKKIEEQTNGMISMKDFFPVPCITPVSDFIEALTNQPQYKLSIHFACGAATYLFLDGDRVVPITRFVDVEGFFEFLKEKTGEIEQGKNKALVTAKVLMKLGSFIDKKKQPKDLNLTKLLFNALVKHDYDALGAIHNKTLFIGLMHFMDPYLYDQQRVERCDIHYAMPDGRIIPFCSFNVIPEIYRDKVQAQYSVPAEEWQKKNPKESISYKYARDIEKLTQDERYGKTYSEAKNFFEKEKVLAYEKGMARRFKLW
ncbi:MAG: tetraether lipid synthase Tes [Candidatus Diapherotrites archaeon]